MPKVSVCIPTYNTARYLGKAIESVLQQTYRDYELVICDNASTDETPGLVRQYNDPRIRYVRYDELVNQGGNWNRCVSLATGEYVALLHADDEYLPAFLGQRVGALDRHPEVGLAFGAVQIVNSGSNVTGQQIFRDQPFIVPAPEFYKDLLFGCFISPVSPVVRRSCYEAVGRFNDDKERLWGIDWEMWLRISASYGVAYTPEILASYRIHESSGTSVGLLNARNGAQDLLVLQNAFRLIEERPELKQFSHLRRSAFRNLALRTLYAAGYNCEQGNVRGIRENLKFALRTDSSLIARPIVWTLWLSCYLGSWVYRAFRQMRPA